MLGRRQIVLVAATLIATANATCQLSNVFTGSMKGIPTGQQLCEPQGEGQWTFAMALDMIDVPTFDGSSPNDGNVQGNAFIIYDNACKVRGMYGPDNQNNNCGSPYVIMDNFLADVLTIKDVDFNVGGGYFSFAYGNGLYSIGNNHCTCSNMSSGLTGAQGCKCAFPVSGSASSDSKEAVKAGSKGPQTSESEKASPSSAKKDAQKATTLATAKGKSAAPKTTKQA